MTVDIIDEAALSSSRSLSNEEVNVLQEQVQKRVVNEMGIQMR
mgnify:CR=1 FL=1|jgi:phenylalanyl-tRNA synthetase beta subunit